MGLTSQKKKLSLVNKINAYLEWGELYILIHWFSSFQIHLHIGSFDKELTICRYGVWIG